MRRVKVLNYTDCFELSNGETRVTLCHQVGGRVLEYFTEDWYLLPHPFPLPGSGIDLDKLAAQVAQEAR